MVLNGKSTLYFAIWIGGWFLSACIDSEHPLTSVEGAAWAHVFTWNDVNGNGIYEFEEPTIPYITTSIRYPNYLTGFGGWGNPWQFLPGCSRDCWKSESVYVKVPPGYSPTTPIEYELTDAYEYYYFGFQVNDESSVVSFPGEPEWYQAFVNRGGGVQTFHYTESRIIDITVDLEAVTTDEYYPVNQEEYDIDFYIFDIITDLYEDYEVDIQAVRITILPQGRFIDCSRYVITNYEGRLSAKEIIAQECHNR